MEVNGGMMNCRITAANGCYMTKYASLRRVVEAAYSFGTIHRGLEIEILNLSTGKVEGCFTVRRDQ